LGQTSLKVPVHDEFERKLKEAGYSDEAVTEILKWYKNEKNDREA
jgi:predicted Ser/Thr protein kinase